MKSTLDRFDIRLLNLLQANSLATAKELAQKVPLSPSAIARRVRQLRPDGAISADVAVLAPGLVEDRIQTIVNVALQEQALDRGLAALRDRLMQCPEVQLCFEVSGAFELTLLTSTRGMAAFNTFADEMLTADPAVRRYEASFVKKTVKATLGVPLDPADWD